MRSKWHKLREEKDGEASMYLIASFNNWFPIKMKANPNFADEQLKVDKKQSNRGSMQSNITADKKKSSVMSDSTMRDRASMMSNLPQGSTLLPGKMTSVQKAKLPYVLGRA